MSIEYHPFGEFIPKKAKGIIIGSFPIGKFTNPKRSHEIKAHELNFFFGGEKNLLWKLISQARNLELKNTQDIVDMLTDLQLGAGDVIKSCRRKEGGASDSDLYDITFNHDLLNIIQKNKIQIVYFTSRKVEQWFEKLFPDTPELIKISLISPSAQTLRSIGRHPHFNKWKAKHPEKKAMDFLFEEYKRIFSKMDWD